MTGGRSKRQRRAPSALDSSTAGGAGPLPVSRGGTGVPATRALTANEAPGTSVPFPGSTRSSIAGAAEPGDQSVCHASSVGPGANATAAVSDSSAAETAVSGARAASGGTVSASGVVWSRCSASLRTACASSPEVWLPGEASRSSAFRSQERSPAKRLSSDSSQPSQRGVSRHMDRAARTSERSAPAANRASRAHAVPGVRGSARPAVTANASSTLAAALARSA